MDLAGARPKLASRKFICHLRRVRVVTLSARLTDSFLNFLDVVVQIWHHRSRAGLISDIHHICVNLRKTSKGDVFIVIEAVSCVVKLIGHLER
jgi:hypothetical protein